MDCPTGKAQFTAAKAKLKAKRASRRYSQPMAPYRCEECGQWHIGHPSSLGKPIPIIQANHHITTKERE